MTELTRFAHDEHGHTYPDELGDYYLVDETQKLIATLREQLEARDGEIARLREASLALYNAGRWVAENVPCATQVAMWERLRDALMLPHGHATGLGVGAASANETPHGECVAWVAERFQHWLKEHPAHENTRMYGAILRALSTTGGK